MHVSQKAADLHACVELVAGRGGHVAEVSSARTHTALERAWPPRRETQRSLRWCESSPLHLASAMGNSEVVKLKTPLGQSDGKHKGPDPQAQDSTAIGQSDWKLKGRGDGANPSSGSTTHEAVSDKLRSYKEEAKRLRQELHSLRMRELLF